MVPPDGFDAVLPPELPPEGMELGGDPEGVDGAPPLDGDPLVVCGLELLKQPLSAIENKEMVNTLASAFMDYSPENCIQV